ncbi:MAG: cell wall hydrolase [bacterium]|jgi:N-acetylmuramoyl-L-alanine amidase
MFKKKTPLFFLLSMLLLISTIFPATVYASTYRVQPGDSLFFIAQRFNTTVSAIQQTNNIYGSLIYPGELLYIPSHASRTSTRAAVTATTFSNYEVDLIARMIHAEAEAEPYIGKVAVGAVIINRVKHPDFPNTLHGVLFSPWEFEPVMNNRFWQITPSAEAYAAARDALAGWDPTGGAIYFYNPQLASSWWIFSRQVISRIGKHVFAI